MLRLTDTINAHLGLEGSTRFFGQHILAHGNLGCLCAVAGAISFWICLYPTWSKLSKLTGIPGHEHTGLTLFCLAEAFVRGIWITLLLKRHVIVYVVPSIIVVPLAALLWIPLNVLLRFLDWAYNGSEILPSILLPALGTFIVLSAVTGVGITRIFQNKMHAFQA